MNEYLLFFNGLLQEDRAYEVRDGKLTILDEDDELESGTLITLVKNGQKIKEFKFSKYQSKIESVTIEKPTKIEGYRFKI